MLFRSAPTRKFDPGPRFDWRGLACQGLSVWPRAGSAPTVSAEAFLRDAATFGYRLHADVTPDDILRAFRTRFRPGLSGPLDPRDCGMIADLARRFPVDRDTATAYAGPRAEGWMAAAGVSPSRKVRTPQDNGAG